MKTDAEISRQAKLSHIKEIATQLNIDEQHLNYYGQTKAKINYDFAKKVEKNKNGKLILVTAMSPTPAGEGKTTTTVGLGDALNLVGKKTTVCLREPSLGPCFGVKGGGTGGGYAQIVPMDEINLHFTGDFHAITSAHNLLAALIDNHIQWGNKLNIDPRKVVWKRVLDVNDRALRNIVTGLGGAAHGVPKEAGFDITVASEVMAIFCLATDLKDLASRLSNITVAYDYDNKAIYAKDVEATGAMMALLKDAFMPNIVQTLENNPAFVHGGPFANIAHGCSSVVATKLALKLSDYVVTEAGFGADLGAEKFFDIKCRKSGLVPNAVVLVATIRALKMHGQVALSDLKTENVDAVKLGCKNLGQHIKNLAQFGVPVTVAINGFTLDTDKEMQVVIDYCQQFNVAVHKCAHWADGGKGSQDLARHVVKIVEGQSAQFRTLYDDSLPLLQKMKHVARNIYGADDIIADQKIRDKLQQFEKDGYGHFPICVAKTQYSFSTDPSLLGAPTGHSVPIRDVVLATGAQFIVMICGAVMTMPGLPRVPSANHIYVDDNADIHGLF